MRIRYSVLLVFSLFITLSSTYASSDVCEESIDDNIEHHIVFYEENKFAAWPANNGIWVWKDEILVGFVEANHNDDVKGLHTYDPKSAINKYARSKDGGVTWSIEDAFDNGQKAWGFDNHVSEDVSIPPQIITQPMSNINSPDFIFTIQRHSNNKGPSHFYYSDNRGLSWKGAYWFPELDTPGIASRTDYIVDGEKEISAFITVAKTNSKEGRVALVRTLDGGVNWDIVSWVGEELEGFDIMPSSLRLSKDELITIIRTRTGTGQNLLTGYKSNDDGISWVKLDDPVDDTGKGGSPPSLVKLRDGRLALSYIYRSDNDSKVNIKFSSDNGLTWSDEIVVRGKDGTNRDCGYPRMVQREDGKLVIVYYWNNVNAESAKPFRYIASTIVDPDNYKYIF